MKKIKHPIWIPLTLDIMKLIKEEYKLNIIGIVKEGDYNIIYLSEYISFGEEERANKKKKLDKWI